MHQNKKVRKLMKIEESILLKKKTANYYFRQISQLIFEKNESLQIPQKPSEEPIFHFFSIPNKTTPCPDH